MNRDRSRPLRLVLPLILALILTFIPPKAWGGEGNLQVLFLIDNSGSMNSSDPDGLRLAAVNMFIDQLAAGDQAGAATFTETAKELMPIVSLQDNNRKLIKEKVLAIGKANGRTDLSGALNRALAGFPEDIPGSRKAVIVISDGIPSPTPTYSLDKGEREKYEKKLRELAGAFLEKGIAIYTIEVSKQTGQPVYKQLSELTRGEHYRVRTPGEVAEALWGIRKKAQRLIPLKVETKPGSREQRVKVEPFIKKMVLRITSSGTSSGISSGASAGASAGAETAQPRIIDSEGRPLAEPRFAIADNPPFRVYTMANPREGLWRIDLPPGTTLAAYGETRYAIRLQSPQNNSLQPVRADIGVEALVVDENGRGVAGDDGSLVVSTPEKSFLLYDDGQGGDIEAGDGRYAGILSSSTEGAVPLTFRFKDGSGRTLASKETTFYFRAVPYLEYPGIRWGYPDQPLSINGRVAVSGGKEWQGWLENYRVYAEIAGADKNKEILELKRGKDQEFFTGDFVFSKAGPYTVNLILKGLLSGQPYRYETGPRQMEVLQTSPLRMELAEKLPDWPVAGRNIDLAFRVWSPDLKTPANFSIDGKVDGYLIEPVQFRLVSRQPLVVKVRLSPLPGEKPGAYNGELWARQKDSPAKVRYPLTFRTVYPWLTWWYGSSTWFKTALWGGCGLLVVWLTGTLAYWLRVRPRLKVKGQLLYVNEEGGGLPGRINLEQAVGNNVILGKAEDKVVQVEGPGGLFELRVCTGRQAPKFFQGLQALWGNIETRVEIAATGNQYLKINKATPFGMRDMQVREDLLWHDDRFSIGGLNFVYKNQELPTRRTAKEDL